METREGREGWSQGREVGRDEGLGMEVGRDGVQGRWGGMGSED